MNHVNFPTFGLMLAGTALALVLAFVMVLVACAPAPSSNNAQARAAETQTLPPPTSVPTFTPTPSAPTSTPTAVNTATTPPTETVMPSDTPTPMNTVPPAPPTSTPRPRPTNTPLPPPPPTAPPAAAVDFKVVEARLFSAKENQGTSVNGSIQECGLLHVYQIKVIDKNGTPLDGIKIKRVYAGNIDIPPTGVKGPGKTEEVPPRYAGDKLYVFGDTSGARFTSEQTRDLSLNDKDISNAELIAGGYCRDDAECNNRKANNLLCLGHYSYSIVFQRTR